MRMHPRHYPPNRRSDPKRQAEHRVYDALAAIGRRGFCYYEWRKGYERIELDFAVWIPDLGRLRPAGEGRPLSARRRRLVSRQP